jgi:recombination protein U
MGITIDEYKKMVGKISDLKNPNRQIIGRISHGIGANFEKEVEKICKIYEEKKLAKIEKTPEPMKILKHVENGRFEAIFTKAAQPDFKGTLKGGKTVVFDAKYTESDRIRYQVLSDFQRQTLLQYKELGAEAFILVGFQDGAIYRIDVETWDGMKENMGRKYILQKELNEMQLEAKNVKGVIDFLRVI